MRMEIDPVKGILSSNASSSKNKSDEVHLSDIQRYACISENYKEIPIKEYHSNAISNDNTLKIAKVLYSAHTKLDSNRGNINLTSKSAAFMVFLGTDVNLSKIFLTNDLGRHIQGISIQEGGSSQLKFTPAEQSPEGTSTSFWNKSTLTRLFSHLYR
jgi:hypothetical protein